MKIITEFFLVLTLICVFKTNIFSQSYQSLSVGYQVSSGMHNETNLNEYDKVFETNINIDNVPWIQLIFSDYYLGNNSFIKIIYDGVKECILNNNTINYWYGHSPLLRGNSFHLELYKASNDNNLFFNIDSINTGTFSTEYPIIPPCSYDNRVPDNSNPNIGRIRMDDGNWGTGWLTKTQKVVTAQHLVANYIGVTQHIGILEFDVPNSNPDGTMIPSDVINQYVISGVASHSADHVPGFDWATLWVQDNGYIGHELFTNRSGIDVRKLLLSPPATTLTIIGFGKASGIKNGTMQKISGPLVSTSNALIDFGIFIAGGNSGGTPIDNNRWK